MEMSSDKEKSLELIARLCAIKDKREKGQKGYSPEEVYEILGQVISQTTENDD